MNKQSGDNKYLAVFRAINDTLPGVYNLLGRLEEDFDRLNIKRRGDHDWIAVCKAFSDDGTPIVCFASGVDLVGCLVALDGVIQAGRWRADTPWKGSK